MNVLDIFSGIGGGILGHVLCGHRIVCGVESDVYCRSVLVRRQNDGLLPPFPIWDDVRLFRGRPWRGIVDVVSGGFPCQNISPAGDRSGITGEKSSLWFEMLRIIREVRPRYVFVENSSQLVRNGLDVVLGGLAESGYDAEWCVLGADDVGAPHIRKRCWILGRHADGKRALPVGKVQKKNTDTGRVGKNPDTDGQRQLQSERFIENFGQRFSDGSWWQTEPGVGRVVDECPHRLERIKGLGNAQVPLCAAVAWTVLFERIHEERS